MRYATAEPTQPYDKVRHVLFVCSCGRATDQLMAETAQIA
jgi:hypothetical protein